MVAGPQPTAAPHPFTELVQTQLQDASSPSPDEAAASSRPQPALATCEGSEGDQAEKGSADDTTLDADTFKAATPKAMVAIADNPTATGPKAATPNGATAAAARADGEDKENGPCPRARGASPRVPAISRSISAGVVL